MSPPAAMRDACSRSSMMRSRVRALRSMISSARSVSAAIDAALPEQAEPHQDRSQRRAQLVGEQRQELVLEVARVLRAVPRGLLPLQERGDVAGDPAAVDELRRRGRGCSPRSAPAGWSRRSRAGPPRSSSTVSWRRRRPRTSSAAWGSTKNSAMEWPTHSSSAQPSSSEQARFAQRSRPSGSTQQRPTGALARNSTSSSSLSGGRVPSGASISPCGSRGWRRR